MRIALSYRRDDSEAITGRLFDRLAAHFGRDAVFRDIDNIAAGHDYRLQVKGALAACEVLVAVIGRGWRGHLRNGRARIVEEADPVRIELEMALRGGIPIIPVLVGPAKMPPPEQLPPSLESIVYRHACRVDPGEDFDHHADRLIRQIGLTLGGQAREVEPARPEAMPAPMAAERHYGISLDAAEADVRCECAPSQWGGYARSSLSHYPGTYVVVRPAFKTRGNLYSYLVDIGWDDVGGGLIFRERARTDTRHTQHGRIWIPSPSDYLYLVSGRDGWLRSITLSFLDDENEMRGLVSTLHNVSGALYTPVAAPIVFVQTDEVDDGALGELTPDHPNHPAHLARLRRAVAEGSAQLITV